MTTGALIFAFNNEHIDYIKLAAWNANNIRRHLGIPVAIVTNDVDHVLAKSQFDHVIHAEQHAGGTRFFSDYNQSVTWYNAGRPESLDLTPWDTTLVLDADYVVASSALSTVINSASDFMCFRSAFDAATGKNLVSHATFGRYQAPMYWATVMKFSNNNTAKFVFDSMKMIRNNWTHYRNLYSNSRSTYRNDHALSIALNIENGHTLETTDIPWGLASLTPDHQLTQIASDCYRVDFVTADGKSRWIELTADFHAMGKQQLGAIVANNS
jgi:hypothetical protein